MKLSYFYTFITLGLFSQVALCAQIPNVADQVIRSIFGSQVQERWLKMAEKDAEQFNHAALAAVDKSSAKAAIKRYQTDEFRFVEHSWKFNDSKPRDQFRADTANALELLKTKYGIVPDRNFIERFIIFIDEVSS